MLVDKLKPYTETIIIIFAVSLIVSMTVSLVDTLCDNWTLGEKTITIAMALLIFNKIKQVLRKIYAPLFKEMDIPKRVQTYAAAIFLTIVAVAGSLALIGGVITTVHSVWVNNGVMVGLGVLILWTALIAGITWAVTFMVFEC